MPPASQSTRVPGNVRYALALIAVHLLVNIIHGSAHMHFAIPMDLWQKVFIFVVILAAPLGAGLLLWRGSLRAGGIMLLISMAGSLFFGLYFHFLLLGPDHVSAVISHSWGAAFQLTAFLLAATEVLGAAAAVRVLRSIS